MNPDDESERLRERERGSKARQIVDNPLWAEAWTTLDAKLTDAWKASQTGMSERRELIYLQLRAAAEVRGHIETVLETGQLAEMQLDEHERERHSSADQRA
jgi:hypothetical protein